MTKTVVIALTVMMSLVFRGCVGSPVHMTRTYNRVPDDISRNNENMMTLTIGMTKDQVAAHMGQPERSEGYEWGSAWLYRTAMTSGIYGTADSDFTPVVFDQNGKLVGWGRNFFIEHVRRYEIKLQHE
jgi:outer membrane protein assembly factor BamE (lipoprotein component of BamABCDE complex)